MVIRKALVFSALVLAGCVLSPVSLDGKKCDDSHACVRNYWCKAGTCVRCADHDGDGALPTQCGGEDCNDDDPAVGPNQAEVCGNGKDDDCNGLTDAADPVCQCRENDTESCGTCPGAIATCHGGSFGTCVPPPELCNGLDDDCNGTPDDAPGFECVKGSAESCTTSCNTPGTRHCDEGCEWGRCIGVEVCNGQDDDCDSVPDNGFDCAAGTSGPCNTVCGTTGTATCTASCTRGECVPPAETCNGKDDDCDGNADNGFACVKGAAAPGTATCTTSCGTTGKLLCNDACSAFDVCQPPGEICNGADEDCDGVPDNGLTGSAGALAGTASAVAVGNGTDGLVAYATVLSSGTTTPLVVSLGPTSGPHVTLNAVNSLPRDPAVAVGAGSIAVVWVDDPTQTARMALAERSAAATIRSEFQLGAVTAGTRVRVAFVPGNPGSYLVTFLQGGAAKWILVNEAGQPGAVHTLPFTPAAGLRFVSAAATTDGRAVLGYGTDAGNGTMHPFVVFLAPGPGTLGTAIPITWSAPGVLRDDGVEVAASDAVTAAFAVVDSTTGTDIRAVVAAPVAGATAQADTVSGAGEPVLGSVRIAAQPGGTLVTWTEADGSNTALGSVALLGTAAPRRHRIDEPSAPTYVPAGPDGAMAAWDGATYDVVWIDVNAAWSRRLCP